MPLRFEPIAWCRWARLGPSPTRIARRLTPASRITSPLSDLVARPQEPDQDDGEDERGRHEPVRVELVVRADAERERAARRRARASRRSGPTPARWPRSEYSPPRQKTSTVTRPRNGSQSVSARQSTPQRIESAPW